MRIIAAALIAASSINSPALAADLPSFTSGSARVEQAVFAGARVRIHLGGERSARARAGLAIAPMRLDRSPDGDVRRRYAEGFEFGFASGDARPAARFAGYRLSGTGPVDERGRKLGLNTIETAAVVGGVVLLAGVIVALAVRSDDGCCD